MKAVEKIHHVLEFQGPQRRLGHCQLIKTKTYSSGLGILILLGRRRLFRVDGDSMLPALKPGDRVIATPYRGEQLQSGAVVVVTHLAKPC